MAKSKSKQKKRNRPDDSCDSTDQPKDTANESPVLGDELPPIVPRPLAFKVSLLLLIGWLAFLAYIAYRVTFS